MAQTGSNVHKNATQCCNLAYWRHGDHDGQHSPTVHRLGVPRVIDYHAVDFTQAIADCMACAYVHVSVVPSVSGVQVRQGRICALDCVSG